MISKWSEETPDFPLWEIGWRYYQATEQTIGEILKIENRPFRGTSAESALRIITDPEEKLKVFCQHSVVTFSPNCRDWCLLESFDGETWPQVLRNVSLADALYIAKQASDGIKLVHLRPATPDEVSEYDRRAMRESNDAAKEARKQDLGNIAFFLSMVAGSVYITASNSSSLIRILAGFVAASLALYGAAYLIGCGFRKGKAANIPSGKSSS